MTTILVSEILTEATEAVRPTATSLGLKNSLAAIGQYSPIVLSFCQESAHEEAGLLGP
jgi:hypothetical protein